MNVQTTLRFNFASPGGDTGRQRDALTAAVEMARYGEPRGISAVTVDEHHATGHGWCANPILAATPFLATTDTLVASVNCALGPMWDPVRLAEDIAFVDTFSGGRLYVTVGLGYREVEFDLFGIKSSQRGRLLDQLLDTMLGVWSESNKADAENGVARTWTKPYPPLFVGGGVRATAKRAAERGLPVNLPDYLPDIADYYRELCQARGVQPVVIMPSEHNTGMTYLHEDPDKAWAELGEHILWEATTYGAWDGTRSMMHLPGVKTLDEVKASGRYRFVTADELIAELRGGGGDNAVILHPLVGSMPIDEAWKSVHMLTDTVLPALS